jgi:hypothetical protein
MALNPFAGTEFEDSWNHGFSAGFIEPGADHPAPSPLTVEQQEAFSRGVLAGQISKRGVVVPQSGLPQGHESWKDIAHGGEILVEAGHALIKIVTKTGPVVGTVGEASLGIFVSVAIWGPDRPPFFEEAAAQALARLRKQLQEAGVISDNVELFMGACNRTDHGMSGQDELTNQGWFHGKVFLGFDQALAEATAHGHPDDTRVLRFQSVAPDTIDVIELNTAP